MVDINPAISVIILNSKGLNAPIKRQMLSVKMDAKNKTQLKVVYQKPILNMKTHMN
jgi:hypothetical protein